MIKLRSKKEIELSLVGYLAIAKLLCVAVCYGYRRLAESPLVAA